MAQDVQRSLALLLLDLRRGARFSPATLTTNLCTSASLDKTGQVVAALLAAGADPNGVSEGRPPLMWAAISGNVAVVRALCAAGADVNACTDATFEAGEVGIVTSILHATKYDLAPEQAYVDVLRALADAGRDVTRCVANGRPVIPLHVAAAEGLAAILQYLLDSGAPVDATTGNIFGAPALHIAVESPFAMKHLSPSDAVERSLLCVKRLLRAGADTRLRAVNGALPVEPVLLVGDLRAADAIFAAEERRGIVVAADDAAAHGWPARVKEENALRAAVAAYRRTGDAAVPQALRKSIFLIPDSFLRRVHEEGWSVMPSRAGDDKDKLGQAVRHVINIEPEYNEETEALQAALAAQVPREAAAAAHRCAAPGCTAVGALLKQCPCRSAYYCRCARVAHSQALCPCVLRMQHARSMVFLHHHRC